MKVNLYDMEVDGEGHVHLVKEKTLNYDAALKIGSPADAADMFIRLTHIDKKAEEHIYMLSLNASCEVAGLFFISKGSATASYMTPRELYMRALISGAVQIIICHNHPSGAAVPSSDDIEITKKLKDAGELVGIKLSDHIIIGGMENKKYFSLREAGLLEGA